MTTSTRAIAGSARSAAGPGTPTASRCSSTSTIRQTQLRYRRVPLAISALALICIVAFIIAGKAFGGLIVVALAATTWSMFFRPLYRRRYREALGELPSWQIEPESASLPRPGAVDTTRQIS